VSLILNYSTTYSSSSKSEGDTWVSFLVRLVSEIHSCKKSNAGETHVIQDSARNPPLESSWNPHERIAYFYHGCRSAVSPPGVYRPPKPEPPKQEPHTYLRSYLDHYYTVCVPGSIRLADYWWSRGHARHILLARIQLWLLQRWSFINVRKHGYLLPPSLSSPSFYCYPD